MTEGNPQPPPEAEGQNPEEAKPKKTKPKKLSRKEKLRLKKEKLEQERLEQERREAELREEKEREEERKKVQEQQARLAEEDIHITAIREKRLQEGQGLLNKLLQEEDWRVFSACSHFVDVRSQADVNTFISQWSEYQEQDLPSLFNVINSSVLIMDQLYEKQEEMLIEGCLEKSKEFKELHEKLNSTILNKLENLTSVLLTFSDRFIGAKNEVLLNESTKKFNYHIWINLSKNPRNKEIDFADVKIEIPKSVAMASIAIRLIRSHCEIVSPQYLFIEKGLVIDFFQLPTPPKKIGGMVLRQTPSRQSLVKLTYPIRNVTAAQPPLNFRIKVAPDIINDYSPEITVVEITEDGKITDERVKNVVVDREHFLVQFSAQGIGNFSIAVPKYQHFPFQYWEINPISSTKIEIFIKTKLADITITVNNQGKCSLKTPFVFNDEGDGLSPNLLLLKLQDKGINLYSPEQTEGIRSKANDLEVVLHSGIAECANGFSLAWSKWNSVLNSDRATFLVQDVPDFNQVTEPPKEEEVPEGTKPPNKFSKYHTLLVKANHIQEIINCEEDNDWDPKQVKNGNIHLHLLEMFFDFTKPEVQERVKATPLFMYNSIYELLGHFRLFSSTQ